MLLTGDSEDEAEITSLAQLHRHLTARAAGLSVAPPVDNDGDAFGLAAAWRTARAAPTRITRAGRCG
jgi:hypothetical protein